MKFKILLIKSVFALMIFSVVSFIAFQGIARSQEPYVNKRFGFEIQNPDGWAKPAEAMLKDGGMRVAFSKAKAETMPGLVVTTDYVGNFENLSDYTNFVIEKLKDFYANVGLKMNILEEPREIEMRGLKGIRFVYEVVGPITTKFIDYKFMKNSVFISLTGSDIANNFTKSINDFERIVASFKFHDKEEVAEKVED